MDSGTSPIECAVHASDVAQPLVTATRDGEAVLTIDARSSSATSWAERGNEAVVLEISRRAELLGHVILHQGIDRFTYGIVVGSLEVGDVLTVRVSDLSSTMGSAGACIGKAVLATPTDDWLEAVSHAPLFKWPRAKAFDDVPLLLGWSRKKRSYQAAFTNENGGTAALCGGGAKGMRAEIARWGRGYDLEEVWSYGESPQFKRCTSSGAATADRPRMLEQHPVLYYGDGHNGLFESRGGYANACGTSSDQAADGPLDGWNVNNPGNDVAEDVPFTIVLRPVPVDLDAVGFDALSGRREALVDTYAPWLFRLTDSELAREGKIDDLLTFRMTRYLFVDVYANDVGGSGDDVCSGSVSGGFKLRVTTAGGVTHDGPQMTATFFGGASGVKRVAVPLDAGVAPTDIAAITFDAYDNDGIYFVALGDAFIAEPAGTNGAALEYVNEGIKPVNVYVDDDESSCVNGVNTKGGIAYPCAGSAFTLAL